MKSIFFLFSVIFLRLSGQVNCSFTINPTYSFFSNGVVSYTDTTTFNHSVYVCGNNTTVYDTLQKYRFLCREVYLEKNTIYYFRGDCSIFHSIFARANSTVVILPSTSSTLYLHEPSAVIISSSTMVVISSTCAVLDFGDTECTKTGLVSYGNKNSIRVFPNPVSDQLTVDSKGVESYNIINNLGQTIQEEYLRILNDSFSINTSTLPPGLYLLHLKTQFGTVTKKFIKAN